MDFELTVAEVFMSVEVLSLATF